MWKILQSSAKNPVGFCFFLFKIKKKNLIFPFLVFLINRFGGQQTQNSQFTVSFLTFSIRLLVFEIARSKRQGPREEKIKVIRDGL